MKTRKILTFIWFATYLTVGGIIDYFNGHEISFWANAIGMCMAYLIGVLYGSTYTVEDQ